MRHLYICISSCARFNYFSYILTIGSKQLRREKKKEKRRNSEEERKKDQLKA